MSLDKYKITRFDDEDIKPEETLADALSGHSALEMPIGRGVFGSFFIFISLILLAFLFKSFQLQILNGKNFAASANQNSFSDYQLSGLRGVIYDSEGKPMVENVPVFDLIAAHSFLPEQEILNSEIEKLAPVIGMDKNVLAQAFSENNDKSTFVIKKGLSKEETVRINTLSLQGIFVIANSQRHYLSGPAAAHLIGYTGLVTPQDLKEDEYYSLNDRIGRSGLEEEYEQYLRGDHRGIDLTNKNYLTDQQSVTPGQDIFLNINSEVQQHLYQSLSSVFASSGVRRGAAILQNPKTGAVLGIVSMPSFDGNYFVDTSDPLNSGRISQIFANTDQPLLNRAISGRYSPGSTIKPLLALAGLKEGVVTPSTTIMTNGSITVKSEVDPNVVYTFRDWRNNGLTDIKKAIADSVDVYFYALGGGYGNISGLGISRIVNYLKSMKADQPTGIDLPSEATGFVPSPEWKKDTKGESWYVGDTYNISIGQGDLVVTPAWINDYISAIANGGNLMKPFIVNEIKDASGKTIKKITPQLVEKIPFDQQTIDIVRQGMRQTVTAGTSTLLQDLPVPVAAKTGTAQISSGKALNSLFTVFGPYDDPEITMTVLVENINQSQGLAIRVANDFLSWYFKEFKKQPGN